MRILAFVMLLWIPLLTSAISPLTRSNRYFVDAASNVVFLAGAHNWKTVQDGSLLTPMDWNGYLDFCTSRNYNFIRLWQMDQPSVYYHAEWGTISPMPWNRTGPGLAKDGLLKWDLSSFNQTYFDRLSNRVAAAEACGIYCSVMLWDGVSIRGFNHSWSSNQYNPDNNINGSSITTNTVYTMSDPKWLELMTNYVRKVVDTVNGFDGVMYEIGNEMPGNSIEFQYYIIELIRSYEAGKPKQHLIGMTCLDYQSTAWDKMDVNQVLTRSSADWVSLFGGGNHLLDPPVVDAYPKVSIYDSDHTYGAQATMTWVWRSFLRGHNVISMDHWDFPAQPAVDEAGRKALTDIRKFATRVDLKSMSPVADTSICSSGFCLTNAAREFLCFQPTRGTLQLTVPAGDYTYLKFDPSSRTYSVEPDLGKLNQPATKTFSWTMPKGWTNMVILCKPSKKAIGDAVPVTNTIRE